jgi:hypothetical protein
MKFICYFYKQRGGKYALHLICLLVYNLREILTCLGRYQPYPIQYLGQHPPLILVSVFLSFTTSVSMNKVYIFSEKSNYMKFNHIFRINHWHITYKISTIRYISIYIFTWCTYNIRVFYSFSLNFGQNLLSLTFLKNISLMLWNGGST